MCDYDPNLLIIAFGHSDAMGKIGSSETCRRAALSTTMPFEYEDILSCSASRRSQGSRSGDEY